MVARISVSTSCDDTDPSRSVARASVTLWPTVNAVTRMARRRQSRIPKGMPNAEFEVDDQ